MKPLLSATFIIFSIFGLNKNTKNIQHIYENFSFNEKNPKTLMSEFTWTKKHNIKVENEDAKKIIEQIKSQEETRSFLQF